MEFVEGLFIGAGITGAAAYFILIEPLWFWWDRSLKGWRESIDQCDRLIALSSQLRDENSALHARLNEEITRRGEWWREGSSPPWEGERG